MQAHLCQECTLDHCIRCSSSSICVECDEDNNFYVEDGEDTCSECKTSEDKFISEGKCVDCTQTGCSDCTSLTTCSKCNEGLNFYLDGQVCKFCDPAENKFIEDGLCKDCILDNCTRCSSPSVCAECDAASSYYLKEGETTCSECKANENKFLSGGKCQLCGLTGCTTCSSLSVCGQC